MHDLRVFAFCVSEKAMLMVAVVKVVQMMNMMMNMMTMTRMRTQVLCSPPTAENGEEHLMLQQSAPDSKS